MIILQVLINQKHKLIYIAQDFTGVPLFLRRPVYLITGSTFKVSLHHAKMKFFRSLNGIFSKLGASFSIQVALYLVSAYCNPVLFYGLESLHLKKTDYNCISYPYNCTYTKLFSTFDKNIIAMCQFYTGQLPLDHKIDLRTLNFYHGLAENNSNPANMLFK
jgi:hypothetical protein